MSVKPFHAQRRGGAPPCVARSWVRVGLPRHDREVEGVVVKDDDDAILELRVRSGRGCCREG